MSKFHFVSLIVFTALSFSLTAFAINDTAVKIKWNHTDRGPDAWGRLSPDFKPCSIGKTQSPIDLTDHPIKQSDTLAIHYNPATMIIMDNGSTKIQIGHVQRLINTGHGVQLNFPNIKPYETITLEGKKYKLIQFHFHIPSEHKLQGKSFPLEIHFVNQGDNGTLTAIGVFAQIGEKNPIIQKIVDHIPKKEGITYEFSDEHINPSSLIPTNHDYYHYTGSLTTPPCSEPLNWIVMKEPITISQDQVNKLKAAAGGDNSRPIQELNGRQIYFSVKK